MRHRQSSPRTESSRVPARQVGNLVVMQIALAVQHQPKSRDMWTGCRIRVQARFSAMCFQVIGRACWEKDRIEELHDSFIAPFRAPKAHAERTKRVDMESRRHQHSGSHGGGRPYDHHHNANRRGRGSGRGGGGRGGGGRGGHSNHHHKHNNNNNSYHPGRSSYWFKGEGYNDHESVSIDEEVVGINGYLSSAQPGFSGLVKQRFSDFVVHEIAKNGQQVTLTSLAKKKKHVSTQFQELVNGFAYGKSKEEQSAAAPDHIERQQIVRDIGERLGRQSYELTKLGHDALEKHNVRKLIQLVTTELGKKKGKDFEDFIEKVKQLKLADEQLQQAAGDSSSAGRDGESSSQDPEALVFYIGGLNEKSDRVFLHETMRRYGKSLIVADTITSEDHSQVIRVRRAFLTLGKKGVRDPRREWPVEQPDYLQFVLYRRNKDIASVINQIASMLKVNATTFSYADAKDKRGITTQLCTAYRLPKERLQQLQKFNTNKALDEFQYLIGGNLKYVPAKLSLGDCQGNHFSLAIRALAEKDLATAQSVQESVNHWCQRGFINFFGLQRFGNSATPFHLFGRAILRKDFKLAVRLLLRPQDGEASKIREAREHFRQHKDVVAALRMLPPFLIPERAVLEGLLQHGIEANELAFRSIPLSIRVAYVEAYQNYVWNEMASARIATLSSEHAVVGDLVFAKTGAVGSESEPATKKQKRDAGDVSGALTQILVLTEENVEEYGIDDVVLPLPGHSVVYPAHAIGSAYEKMLMTDGVDMTSWLGAGGAHHHQYQLDGTYRYVIKKPFHVSAAVREYKNVNKPMLLTDVDGLLHRGLDTTTDAIEAAAIAAGDDEKEPSKLQRALVLSFSLDYGSDATIAVRELMKQSSSMHVQWQLSDQVQSREAFAKRKEKSDSTKPPSSSTTLSQTTTVVKKHAPTTAGATAVGASKGGGDKKIIAQKKTQVSIGRPGFSLGKH